MPKTKHIHKYIKTKGNNTKAFRCAFPDCVFILNPGQFHFLPGRKSHCNKCNEQFIMTEDSLNEDEPICEECKFKTVMTKIGIDENIVEEVGINILDDFLSIKGV